MKKRITIIFCIMFIIFNFIFSSVYFVHAEDYQDGITLENFKVEANGDAVEFFKNQRNNNIPIYSNGEQVGSKSLEQNNKETNNAVVAALVRTCTFIVEWANNIPQKAVEATDNTLNLEYFTIYSLVMGEYDFFNLNFFTTSGDEEDAGIFALIPGEQYGENKLSLGGQIKQNIKTFYYILRTLSFAISLFVLIYIGIRMALSAVTSEQVKYKKMIINWITSLVLLFILHFIIIVFSYASQFALGLVKNLANVMGVSNIEELILDGRIAYMGTATGFHVITSLITVAIFVYYEIKFFIMYVKRFCEIAFLIVIAPLITITYPIDKIADNKAQAFSMWLKELSVKYSIQIVHALTYVIFIASAGVIAQEVPLFAAFFLLALDKAEKIFRNVLNVKDNSFEKIKVPIIGN